MLSLIPLSVDDAATARQQRYQEWCADQGIERSPAAWLIWRNQQLDEAETMWPHWVELYSLTEGES